MAFQFGAGEGDDLPETHEINVTPFIDVILVLLIVFMVAAPLATVELPVHLPAATGQRQPPPEHPSVLTLQADGTLLLGAAAVPANGVAGALDHLTGGDHATPVFLRADGAVPYARVMAVLSALRRAGYGHVSLVGLDSPGRAVTPAAFLAGRDPVRWGLCCLLVLGLHGLLYELVHAPAPPPAIGLSMLVDLAPDPMPDPQPVPAPEVAPPATAETAVPAAEQPIPNPPQPPPAAAIAVPDEPASPVPPVAKALHVQPARPALRRPPVQRQAIRPELAAPTEPVALMHTAAPAVAAASAAPSDPSAVPNWQGQLMRRLHEALRYPAAARVDEVQGVASVSFTMTREGHVLSATLVRSAGHPSLDAEAVAMIRRADPLPQPPPEMTGATLTLSVPVQFSLRDAR